MDYQGKLPRFDYAVKINGDSMEPQFHDQQVVLAQAATDADNGQIVIAYVDGPAVRNIFVGVGVMILIFAILAATPWGADVLLNMFH